MISLRPEALDPEIQNMIFNDLSQTYTLDCQHWRGTPQATDAFMGMISDLKKVIDGKANDTIRERIFIQLRSVKYDYQFPDKATISEYLELFYIKITPDISSGTRNISQRLIAQLCALATGTPLKIQTVLAAKNTEGQQPTFGDMHLTREATWWALTRGAETPLKTRVAAYRLLHSLINPQTQKKFEKYKKEEPDIEQRLAEFGKTIPKLSIEFPYTPQRPLSLIEFGRAVRDGIIKQGDAICINLKTIVEEKGHVCIDLESNASTIVNFHKLDNEHSPNWLLANKEQVFSREKIENITVRDIPDGSSL